MFVKEGFLLMKCCGEVVVVEVFLKKCCGEVLW